MAWAAWLAPCWCATSLGGGASAPRRSKTPSELVQQVAWGDLPAGILAQALSWLSFEERCRAALVCTAWQQLVGSAAAHARDESSIPLAATRLLPCDVDASDEQRRAALLACRATRHGQSAMLPLDAAGAHVLANVLTHVTRLVLLDPAVVRQQQEADAWLRSKGARARPAMTDLLQDSCRNLGVLTIAMSSPLLDAARLPATLQALHLELASGYSSAQLSSLCEELADAAPSLPRLQHISVACELDSLLNTSHADVLNPLSGLAQLTSLSLVEYQFTHASSGAHEGYPAVPAVLQLLPTLRSADLHCSSGHNVELGAAAGVPDVSLALTLAHYEQEPFNRVPPSLTCLRGLTSLSILMAEFAFQEDADMYVFDLRPLAACPRLSRLLLELHGAKGALHDVQGLAGLRHLEELVVLLKCPDVHEARPEAAPASPGGSSGSGGAGAALLPFGAAGAGGSSDGSGSFLASLLPGRLLSLLDGGTAGRGSPAAAAPDSTGSCVSSEEEEWVLQLVDAALDGLRPEFALALPVVSGRLLVATTSRLCLRQPENFTLARAPMLLASGLQLDLAAACGSSDSWGGESFLARLDLRALRSWVVRQWGSHGVRLLEPARYPVLGTYPGCTRRIDDKLLAAARRGVSGDAIVTQLMAIAEERCMSYFS